MKRIATIIVSLSILLTLSQTIFAQATTYEWTQNLGNSDFQYGFDIATDANGNTLTTGYFQGTMDFDPGAGVANLSAAGGYDIFVLKLDSDGNFVWAKHMGGTNNDYGHSIATDASGNVFVTGRFQGTADFDPGAGTTNLISNGGNDIYVLKLDMNGNLDWVKQMGNTGSDQGRGIAVDGNNNVVTTGFFEDAVDFDPNAGTNTITSNGNSDFFVQKLDNAGNLLWAIGTGGNSLEEGLGIAIDGNDAIYTTGFYASFTDFDPGGGTAFSNIQGSKDIFVQKLDANGNYAWHKVFGSNSIDEGYGIAVDNSNNVYTTGLFQNTMDIDPGAGTENITSTGSYDAFIQKLDVNGNYVWGKHFGGTSADYCNSITTDDNGNVYTTGLFYSTADFDPGPGTVNFTSLGLADIFIHSLSSNGDLAWVEILGGNSFNEGRAITLYDNTTIYSTGTFQQSVDFDPGTGTDNRVSAGGNDAYVHKMTQCVTDNVTDVVSTCGPYTWSDGNTYSSSTNTPTQTLTNINGCDSIVTLDLTVGQPNTGTDVQTACGSYTWIDGNTYTSDNNSATFTLTNQSGCDSVVTLDLTIGQPNTGTDVQTQCDSYTWIDGNTYTSDNNTATFTLTNQSGCDSVVTLDLTILNSTTGTDIQNECDSYTWIDGNTYTSDNNTATFTLTNAAGCDSVVTLDLTINNSTTGTDVQTACDSYTWIDGNTYTADNNTATFTLTNAAGCDSVVTLDLTINNSNTGTDVQTACDSYTWIDGNTYTTDNNTATFTLTNQSGCDSVVTLDLTINNSNTGTDVQTACDSYTWIDGNTYTADNNTATFTLTNAAGCDSVVTLDLTIKNSNTGTDTRTECDSYTWIDGNTYTADNNTATFTLTNAAGCDSVVTLDLTILNSTSGTDVQTECDSYTWIDGNTYTSDNNTATYTLTNAAGCDSVVTLDLTILNSTTSTDVQTECDSYTWIDGNTYTSSNNTATFTLTNAAGCDSVVTLDLTITTVNVSTTNNSPTLSADENGASYQWLDCDDNYSVISGETNQSFTAISNGSYAVAVTVDGCTDTSDCMIVDNVGLTQIETQNIFIYPNPTKDKLNIEINTEKRMPYSILDVQGRIVEEGQLNGWKTTIDVSNYANKIYFIKINERVIKFIKN